ncbi:MAG: class I SAM-dependent DNA methyltransferase [Micromonosporaceae bacterium]
MSSEVWDERVAASYDEHAAEMFAPDVLGPTVDFLADLAPGGRALEFAIGTGRVAIPLRERGVTVAGIELSPAMVDVLRTKPGADAIDVAVGDMTSTTSPGEFDLVYVVYNSISNLLTQTEQVACFRNAARHLRPGGHFVVELWVPDLRRLPPGTLAQPFHVSEQRVGLDTYDLLRQQVVSHHYWVEDGKAAVFRSTHRYAWPSELDLMAELAGLRLVERWADWGRAEFTDDSQSHVSVWVK